MAKSTRLERLTDAAKYYGLNVVSWQPDCNVHRFQFFNEAWHRVGGVKTIGAAETWLDAFGQGYLQFERRLREGIETRNSDAVRELVKFTPADILERELAQSGVSTRAETDHLLNREVEQALNQAAERKLYAHGDTCEE